MSTYDEWASDAERTAYLRLERWLISLKDRLSTEEQMVGTALIMDFRRILGLPLLPSPAAPTPEQIEAGRIGNVIPFEKKP